MIKKLIYAVPFMAACSFCFSVDLSRQAAEMNDAYQSGFFPGAVRYADEIISSDSNSIYASRAFVLKGESLFRMGQIEESLACLEEGKKLSKDNDRLLGDLSYWTGRCLFELKQYSDAQKYFYAGAEKSENFRAQSILYAARTFRACGDDKNAVPLYRHVIASGKNYSVSDYEAAALDLLGALNSIKSYDEAVSFADKFETAGFSEAARRSILLEKGTALEGKGLYRKAYELYCGVLKEADSNLAAIAMQKAYYVSSAHRKDVGEEPGAVIAQAKDRLSKYPELVSEFWTRLAIDAFNAGEYAKASEYFDNAASGAGRTLLHTAAVYRCEMLLIQGKQPLKERAAAAEKLLLESRIKEGDELFDYSNLYLARLKAIQEDWNASRSCAEKVLESPDPEIRRRADYWNILSYYKQNDLKASYEKVLDKNYADSDFLFLKAQILAKNGKSSAADRIFYDLAQKNELNNDGRLDYTRTLLNAGHLISATEQSAAAKGAEAAYMAGLAAFNRERWQEAAGKFNSCVTSPDLDKLYRGYARFYLGYCQYRTSDYVSSYSNLNKYVNENASHPLLWNGCMTGAKSAVQAGKYAESFPLAEKAVRFARTEQEKHEAIILCAGIYTDAGRFDEAVKTLEPYAKNNDEFGFECLFQTAHIQTLKKDYAAAEKAYLSVAGRRSSNPFADEALYRYAELSYSQALGLEYEGKSKEAVPLYVKAADRFINYYGRWPSGKFSVAAQYYAADCYLKCGKTGDAKLYYERIVEDRNAGTYKYGSKKALIYIYRAREEYDLAVSTAQSMISEYGEQAENDRIPAILRELKALSSTGNTKLAVKKNEYESAGAEKTPQGRTAGTELAQLYYDSLMLTEAQELAVKLLALQKKNIKTENSGAAANAALLGMIYRSNLQNRSAGEIYLEAAEYYRNSGKEGEAARALYNSAEAFNAAGLYGDSDAVVNNLKKLYPDSTWTKKAGEL